MKYIDKPLYINNKILKNRLVLPPMAPFNMANPDGTVSTNQFKHYAEYAVNGPGMIIVEASAVTKLNEIRTTINLYDHTILGSLSKLASIIKSGGAVGIIQLINTGLSVMEENKISDIPHERYLKYKNDFIKAALFSKKAGFDGIELHAAHGFYLNQVLSDLSRPLKDNSEYICEIIRSIRELCGESFIIGIRIGALKNDSDTVYVAKQCEMAGADYIHMSRGIKADQIPGFEFDFKIYYAKLVKENVHIPVICVGGVKTAAQAERIIEQGYADLIAAGTAQLADHHWAGKILNSIEPVHCLSCERCFWGSDATKCPLSKDIFK